MPKITIINNCNVAIHGLKPGAQIKIEADVNGTPLDFLWRRRLKDSAIDGAIVAVESKSKKTDAIFSDAEQEL